MDVRLVTLESDFNALAVPSPQKFGGMAEPTSPDRARMRFDLVDDKWPSPMSSKAIPARVFLLVYVFS